MSLPSDGRTGYLPAAVLFSTIASCKLKGVEPWTWLRDVLRRIPDIFVSRLLELLPDRWQESQSGDPDAAVTHG